ncbi:5-carboxymethyl-2-hydroxymuconate Delta-isomerase [Rhodovibrionaceae bacterium A322]
MSARSISSEQSPATMPHCIIEYSAPLADDLDITDLVTAVHQGALASGLFAEKDIKTRAVAYPHSHNGTGDRPHVATTVKLLPGRDGEKKEKLGKSVLSSLHDCLGDKASSSVEIADLPQAYFK